MSKNKETLDNTHVKKQTLIGAVVLSLIVGFVFGTIYSSFKLASNSQGQPQNPKGKSVQNAQDVDSDHDHTAEIDSKILQLEQYLQTHPEDAAAWAQLGNQFFDSNQFVNAIEAYTKSLSIDPEKVGVVTDLGVMYRRNKQPKKAIEAFDKAIALDPSFETARFNKGIVLLHDLNDVAGGIGAWEELVRQNPMAMAPNGESVDALVQRMKKQN